jgi:hypothetical protein
VALQQDLHVPNGSLHDLGLLNVRQKNAQTFGGRSPLARDVFSRRVLSSEQLDASRDEAETSEIVVLDDGLRPNEGDVSSQERRKDEQDGMEWGREMQVERGKRSAGDVAWKAATYLDEIRSIVDGSDGALVLVSSVEMGRLKVRLQTEEIANSPKGVGRVSFGCKGIVRLA